MALSREYDAVVTETRVPGINGFALCELLKQDRATQFTSVVFVTGTERPEDVERARRAGADGILVKPCLPETLLLEFQRVLLRSKELRERAARLRTDVG